MTLRRVRKSASVSETVLVEGELTEDQLNRVFEATSSFSIREAYEESHLLLDDEFLSDEKDCESDEEFQLTEDDDFEDDEIFDGGGGRSNGKHRRLIRRDRGLNSQCTENGNFAYSRKRNRNKNTSTVLHLRIPRSPLPVSWGRTVTPFGQPIDRISPLLPSSITHSYPDLLTANLRGFFRKFLGVMINPLWNQKGTSPLVLQDLPIGKLCPEGFLFIWIPKGCLQSIWKLASDWGYSYVENLTWIQLKANNKVRRDQEDDNWILPRSHLTLYIFRKGAKRIEIKHQRSSDLVFDVFDPLMEFKVPQEVYNVIETMLPESKGKLLELWAPKEALKDGWTHLHEQR
eukprot:g2301.t1